MGMHDDSSEDRAARLKAVADDVEKRWVAEFFNEPITSKVWARLVVLTVEAMHDAGLLEPKPGEQHEDTGLITDIDLVNEPICAHTTAPVAARAFREMKKRAMHGCLWPVAWGLSCHVYPHWRTRKGARAFCKEGLKDKASRCHNCTDRRPVAFVPRES